MAQRQRFAHEWLEKRSAALSDRAGAAIRATVAAGIEAYRREIHLPRLLPIDPADLNCLDSRAQRAILARLARALRSERNRGRAGHWTYDLNRHIALRQAYAAERRMLKAEARDRRT